jgi:hypothetical protein
MSRKPTCFWAVALVGLAVAALPLSAGERAAIVLQGDLGPQLRLSQAAQDGPSVPARRIDRSRVGVPEAPNPWIHDHRPLTELLLAPAPKAPSVRDELVVTAQFGGRGETPGGPEAESSQRS